MTRGPGTVTPSHPMWCRVYARKTPTIPVHNGLDTCIGCGADVTVIRQSTASLKGNPHV